MVMSALRVLFGKDGLLFITTNNGLQFTLEQETKHLLNGTSPENLKKYLASVQTEKNNPNPTFPRMMATRNLLKNDLYDRYDLI